MSFEKVGRAKTGKFRKNIGWICAALVLLMIFLRPQAAVDGAQRAMRSWYGSVAPSLLPYLALLPLLTGEEACAFYARAFGGILQKGFHLSAEAAPAVIAALLSGSPGGAMSIERIYRRGSLSAEHAARIALAIGGVSPAYLVLGVGGAMLHSTVEGAKLALIQLCVQLLLLKWLENVEIQTRPTVVRKEVESAGGIRSAVEATLGVCGYMCVFGACGSVAASFSGKAVGIALSAVLDLPSGVAMIVENPFKGSNFALGGTLGFGGLCIAMQNLDRLRALGIDWKEYLSVRCIAAAVTALLCGWLLKPISPAAPSLPDARVIYAFALLTASIFAFAALFSQAQAKK